MQAFPVKFCLLLPYQKPFFSNALWGHAQVTSKPEQSTLMQYILTTLCIYTASVTWHTPLRLPDTCGLRNPLTKQDKETGQHEMPLRS